MEECANLLKQILQNARIHEYFKSYKVFYQVRLAASEGVLEEKLSLLKKFSYKKEAIFPRFNFREYISVSMHCSANIL